MCHVPVVSREMVGRVQSVVGVKVDVGQRSLMDVMLTYVLDMA